MAQQQPLEFSMEAQRKFFIALASDSGIRIEWDSKCTVPQAFANKRIVTPPPMIGKMDEWLCMNHHEISHLFPENFWTYEFFTKVRKVVKDKGKMETLHHIANIFVDNICEKSRWGIYSGRDEILDKGRAVVAQELIKDFTSDTSILSDTNMALMYSLVKWDLKERSKWDGTPYIGSIPVPLPHEVADLYDRIITEFNLDARFSGVTDSDSLLKLTLDLYDFVFDSNSESENEQGDKEQEGEKQEGDKQEGEGERESEEEEEEESGDKEDKEGKDKDKEGKDKDKEDEEQDKKPKKETKAIQKVKEKMSETFKNPMRDLKMERASGTRGPYQPLGNNQYIHVPSGTSSHIYYREDIEKQLRASTLSKQIRKSLLAMKPTRFTPGLTKGKLHTKNMSRMYAYDKMPPIYKEKDTQRLEVDSAVTLLIDCSGSMGGDKYPTASASAIALSDILTSLKIKHEILGFTEHVGAKLVTYIFKEFQESQTKEKLVERFASRSITLGNNADGESLLIAAERLSMRRENNKVLIVLSDGQPATDADGDCDKHLKDVCALIESKSAIHLVGIGIRSDAVKRYYKTHAVVNNISQLNAAVLSTLKGNLLDR